MSDQQKTPLSRTLSSFATQKALDEIQKRGAALPGHVTAVSGPIVTVSIDVEGMSIEDVTMPVLGAEYMRLPIQVGDLGVAFPASLYIGGVSGLGGGVADTTLRGNLSTLVWFPIGNKNWTPSPNADATVLYGPQGVVIQDKAGASPNFSITLNSSGITMAYQGTALLQINASGQVIINDRVFMDHYHSNTPGGSGVGTYTAPSGGGLITGDSGTVV